jgi:hypothetical protein
MMGLPDCVMVGDAGHLVACFVPCLSLAKYRMPCVLCCLMKGPMENHLTPCRVVNV